jgi:diguanylate cyclase (GGDEF)-like protein
MDTHTLVVTNVVLLSLYAGVMLVNARISGGSQGAPWFAGSNLCRAGSFLIFALYGPPDSPLRVSQATGGVLAAVGTMMLYRSFVELLERGPLLRKAQYSLLVIVLLVTIYLMMVPHQFPIGSVLLTILLGVQTAVTAAVVFRFSGEDVGVAGWLTGAALSAYALVLFMRAMVTMRFGSPGYEQIADHMERIWLGSSIVANSAIAFGFMFLSAAKVRVELLWRAQVDELTGLLNRWALKRVAMREILRCRRMKGTLAVVMMDLDGMKAVNDELGHGCGDVVLQAVASVLQETVRVQDSVARMGGDEFCVLLPGTTLAEAVAVAERLRSEVHDLVIRYRGDVVQVRASLGVASSHDCGLTWQTLMDQSDAALYRAKREGKNQVMVAEALGLPAELPVSVDGEGLVEDRRKK